MPSLALHPQTRKLLEHYQAHPFHALLVSGPVGVGLGTIAQQIAAAITEPTHIMTLLPTNGTISITEIRELYGLTRTKQSDRHVVIIDDSDSMGIDAQNTLLKLLEEPSSQVFFILTSHVPQLLLPTVTSRTERIDIRPVDSKSTQELLNSYEIKDDTKRRQISFIAAGLPAEIHRLCVDDAYFALRTAYATDARQFLAAAPYEMLRVAAKYTAKEAALEFLLMLGKFSSHTLYRDADKSSAARLGLIDETMTRLSGNGNVKLQMSRLVMRW